MEEEEELRKKAETWGLYGKKGGKERSCSSNGYMPQFKEEYGG